MKISYRTHAPLKWAVDGIVPDVINIDKADYSFQSHISWAIEQVSKIFERESVALSKKANVIKEAFYEAVISSEERLFGVYADCIQQGVLIDIQETYIYRDYIAFFCSSPKSPTDTLCKYLFIFHKDGTPMLLFSGMGPNFLWVSGLWIPYGTKDREKECKKTLSSAIRNYIDFEIFKKFADVDTVFVNGKSRSKLGSEKIVNDTSVPVLVLDSRWFRSIIRSEGFSVRGHFRLQPKKVNGEWTKELIWINEFEKSGYTSKAKILTAQ